MNAKQAGWARRYQAALRKHLRQGPGSSLRPALGLGRQAVVLGLETLDLARIHQAALAPMISPNHPSPATARLIKRAERFFSETITPVEETHSAAMRAGRHVKQLTATLDRRTSGLAASRRRLKLGISQRRSTEEALRRSRRHYARLLKESHRLQEHLRRLTRRILAAQEAGRKRVSHELQDEIAQTLMGINVRLLTLKTGAGADARSLKKEVVSTQQLVEKSARLMARYTHELGSHHET